MENEDRYETSMYYDYTPAEAAIDRLHGLGYSQDEISVVMNDKTRERAVAAMTKAKGGEGVATGATIGGVLGAIIAGMTATGSVVAVAGTGGLAAPFIAGPLVAALAGLGIGGAGGGILGGLIGLGIGESRAKEYEKGLNEGGILVFVEPKSEEMREKTRDALRSEPERARRGEIDERVDYAGEVRDTAR